MVFHVLKGLVSRELDVEGLDVLLDKQHFSVELGDEFVLSGGSENLVGVVFAVVDVASVLMSLDWLVYCEELLSLIGLDHLTNEFVLKVVDIIVVLVLIEKIFIALCSFVQRGCFYESRFDCSEDQVDIFSLS